MSKTYENYGNEYSECIDSLNDYLGTLEIKSIDY